MDKTPDKYRRQIIEAWVELANAEAVRKAADQRVEDCRELIRANANFLSDYERWAELVLLEMVKRPTNIAEAVRFTLYAARAKNERLTPTQVKENIEARGFKLTDYSNPLASIHTILRRMKDSDSSEIDYDEKTETYLAKSIPLMGMFSDEFRQKVTNNVLKRLAKFDSSEYETVTLEETDKFMNAMSERKRLAES